jgi:hypothetical protein
VARHVAISSWRFSPWLSWLASLAAQARVLEDGELGEHGGALVAAADAGERALRLRPGGDLVAVEMDRAARRRHLAREHVDQRRLAGAIGAAPAFGITSSVLLSFAALAIASADLVLLKTRAVAQPDGGVRLTGTKICISSGMRNALRCASG